MKRIGIFCLILLFCLAFSVGCKKETTVEKQDYFFSHQSVRVTTDDAAKPLLDALGTPTERIVRPSCLFGNANDVLYVYQGLEIETYTKDGIEYLYNIELVDDTADWKTPEGIGVGDARGAVVKAYGEPDSVSQNGTAVYNGKDMTLNFFYTGDTVTRIAYRKNV